MGIFLSPKWRQIQEGMFAHWCPGCKERHIVYIQTPKTNWNVNWAFNWDFINSTLSPSVCHQTNNPRTIEEISNPKTYTKCHYFIRNGRIEFCSDCIHELAGQIVPLPDFPNFNEE